jgi:hypothetical protein
MSGAWTPGPWACDLTAGEVYYNDGDVLPLVATVQCDATSDAQAAADCHLICAAPDMYAALEGLFGLLDAGSLYEPQAFAARAALAKARGESK